MQWINNMDTDLNPRYKLTNERLNAVTKEKLDLAQDFIRCYIPSRQGLTKLGILRSGRILQSDYAEWLAAELLGLRLASNAVQKGYDATDKNGCTYQIKSRIVKAPNLRTSFDFKNIDEKFDYLLGLFFSSTFDLLGIVRVPYKVVGELGNQTRNRFSFRWNNRIAKDPRIDKLFWQDQKVK